MKEYATDSLSSRLPNLLPEFVREESPALEAFLKSYFEYLEAEIITLSSQSVLDNLSLEDGIGDLLLESDTSFSPTSESSKIITEQSVLNPTLNASPFTKGEFIVGSKSKSVARIDIVIDNKIYVDTISGNGFLKGETITGRESKQTGVVGNFKQNSVLASNKLLDYSDIDRTSEEFLQYFQNDFIPSLDIGSTVDRRLTIKHIKDLYQTKGTAESVQFLMRLLYGQDATIRYPDNETIYLNESDYSQVRRMRVQVNSAPPQATDRIIQYTSGTKTVEAESVVENVFVDSVEDRKYSIEITDNHIGEFTQGSTVTFIDRDGLTEYTGTVIGVVNNVSDESSSTYISHDDNGDILLESGQPAVYDGTYDGTQSNTESTFDGGLLLEESSLGSLYSFNDKILFSGSKNNTDASECQARVDGLSKGGITHIYIEEGGQDYEGGDLIVFENAGTQGGGAEAVIGSVGDEVLLEGGSTFGHYEVTATAGQTLVGGPGVRDDNGNLIIFNDNTLKVFVDDVLQTPNTSYTTHDYSHKNDRVVFTTPLTAGQRVDMYTEFNQLLYESGEEINLETTVGNIRSIKILSGGAGYQSVPTAFPGGYIYFDNLTGFVEDEVVTGGISNATATIVRIEEDKKRLVVKRLSTDTGAFQNGETINGGTSLTARANTQASVSSGTGGKIFCFSDEIGGVKSINIIEQGKDYTSDSVVSNSSVFPMLITTPTNTLNKGVVITGQASGTTAEVVDYDADRHILKYTNLDGHFLINEVVTYQNTDQFTILRSNPYNARGKFGGEGIIQEQFVTDKGHVNAAASNLQDSRYYQTHSYVIKVGESINKYRSVVKDLLHPAGHIFFGEVALENSISGQTRTSKFQPTIIMVMEPVLSVSNAFANSLRTYLLHADMTATGPEGGIGLLTLDEAGQPTYNTDPRTGGSITEPDTEYGDSKMRNRHMNILKIVNKSIPSLRVDNVRGVVRSVGSVNLMDNQITLDYHNRKFVAADQGKLIDMFQPSEEVLIMENGDRIQLEDPACLIRFEEREFAEVKGEFGDRILSEDGEYLLRLESETVQDEVLYFLSERTPDYNDKFFYMEDGTRIVDEEGHGILDENSSDTGHTPYTFASFGTNFKSLNTITGQRTYKISYYLKDETDEDDIMLEDGYGNILSEESEPEGLRISDLNDYYPNLWIPEFKQRELKRTNITYSAYVKSA
jgi:hypothetical protein